MLPPCSSLILDLKEKTNHSDIFLACFQCLVSVLKSLVDWERSQRESAELANIGHGSGEESLVRETGDGDVKHKDDLASRFEKAKAHKSTMEAAIAEVRGTHELQIFLFLCPFVKFVSFMLLLNRGCVTYVFSIYKFVLLLCRECVTYVLQFTSLYAHVLADGCSEFILVLFSLVNMWTLILGGTPMSFQCGCRTCIISTWVRQ